MANKWAVQNGNWSDGSTWNDGVVPTAADDVWLNGKTLNITFNEDITISLKSLSNEQNGDLGISQGGYVDITGNSSNPNNTFTFNIAEDILVADRMFHYGSHTNPNQTIGVFNARTLIVNSGYFCSSKSIVYIANRLYIYANIIVNSGYVCNAWAPIIVGDVTINGGYGFQIGNPNAVSPIQPSITGNCTVNDGSYLLSLSIPSGVSINGNVTVNKGNLCGGTNTYDKLLYINGNVYISSIATYGTANAYYGLDINGDFTSYSNASYLFYLLGDQHFRGKTRFLGTALLYQGFNANSTLYIHNEFHTGVLTKFTANAPIPLVVFRDNGKLFYSQPNFFYIAQQMVVDNYDNFGIIYEGEGEPMFYITPFPNVNAGMPIESDVKMGVRYGAGIEYIGTYNPSLPQESTVLKDVHYGDNQVGTLEVIALSGATAQADQIAVVNLTEQEVNRVKNCATVSTVQKCFEDFKEE